MRRISVFAAVVGPLLLVAAASAGAESECPFGVELPDQVTLHVEGEFDDFTIWDLCRAVATANDLIEQHGGVLPATTIWLVDSSRRAQQLSPAPVGRIWGENLLGREFGGEIVMYGREGRSPFTLAAHELFHVVQEPIHEAPWLSEGAAEFLGRWSGFIDNGATGTGAGQPFPATMDWVDAQGGHLRLGDIATHGAFNRHAADGAYAASFAAFHLLTAETEDGIDRYFTCFIEDKTRLGWRAAFRDCFGFTVSEFEVLFEGYRGTGFSELPSERAERLADELRTLAAVCRVGSLNLQAIVVRAAC